MANDVKLRMAMDGAAEVVAGTERIGAGLNSLGTQAQAASKSADTLRTALASIATLATAVAVIKMADAVTTLNTQLNLSTGSAQKAAQAYESLFQIAQKGRVSFTELGTTYAAIARAGNEMGVSQGRLLAVTESISQAMTIGGGSAASMQAALVQLGQGLSSGTLRGEELNSIMEQTPRLAKAIADGLGVPIGELRKLGETGQLTAQQVITALEKAGPQLAKEMASATLTVGQAMTLLGNSATKLVGEMDAASGASASLAGAIKSLSGAMDSVGETINKHQTAFAVITAGLAGATTVAGIYALGAAFVAATPAVLAFAAAFMATPFGPIALALAAVTAGVMGLKAAADAAAKSETGLGYALANLDERIAKLDASQESTWASGKKRLLEMRAERARLSAELALLSNKGLDTRAEDARLGSTTATFKEKEAAVKAYQALKQELSGVNKDFQTHLKQLQAMRDTDQISQKQYVEDVIELIKKEGGAHKAATKPDHKADAFQADVARAYTKALEDLNKEELKATAIAEGYTKTQEILRSVMASPEFAAMSFRKKEEIILAASQAEAESDRATAITKAKKAYDDYVASAKSSADGVDRNLKALQDETNAYAVAAEKNISLAEAIDVVAMARLGDEVIKAKIANNYDAVAQLEREIELRKQLAPLISKRDAHKAEIEANKKVNDEWKKGWEETDRLARDAFTGWAENGTSAAEAIGKALSKALKSAIYEATIRPIAFQIFNSASGGPGGVGGSALSSALGGYASSVGLSTGATAFGGSFTAGIGGGAEAFSAGATMVAEAQGLTSAMAGAGQMLGAAMPYLAAIAVVAAYFEGRPESSANLGDSSATYGANGARLSLDTTNGLNADTTALTAALQASYASAAKSLGIGLAAANYNVNVNNGADAKNPNTIIDSTVNGRNFTSGEISQKDAGALQLAASRAVLNALQASDMPAYMAAVLNGVAASSASQEQITAALQYAQALKTVRTAIDEARTPVQVFQESVDKGFATLATSADTFKADFVKAIDAGLTPENFSAWNDLNATMGQLAESSRAAADALKQTQSATTGSIGNIVKSIDTMRAAVAAADSKVLDAQGSIRSGYLDAQQSLNDLLLQASQNTLNFINSISTFLDTISPAASGGSLASLKAQLSSTAVLAKGGDAASQAALVAQAQAVLASAKTGSRTSVEYTRNEAFVRNLLTDVKATLAPGAALASSAAQPLDAQIAAQQAVVDRYTALAEATGTSIAQSTDTVGEAIAGLKLSYDTAKTEQSAANLKLDVALAALETLGLSESGLKLILASQTNDFAKALGVTNADIQTLTEALGLSKAQVDELTGKLNIKVEDTVYKHLESSLGPLPDLYADLSQIVGPRQGLMKELGAALDLTPIQLASLNSSLNLSDPQKQALKTVLGYDPVETDKLATRLGVDTTQTDKLATAIGLDATAATALGKLNTAIGLAIGMDKTLADMKTQVGFSSVVSNDELGLAAKLGFSDAVVNDVPGLAEKLGFSEDVINDALGLKTAIGLQTGVTTTLATAIGLSGSAATALAEFSLALKNADRTDAIGNAYQTLFGRAPEAAGRAYWESSGLTGSALFEGIRAGAQGENGSGYNDQAAKKLRGFAVGTNFVTSDGPAYLHAGETVTPRPYVDLQSAERRETNALLARLIASNEAMAKELAELRKTSAASADSNKQTATTLKVVTRGGRAMQTEAFA